MAMPGRTWTIALLGLLVACSSDAPSGTGGSGGGNGNGNGNGGGDGGVNGGPDGGGPGQDGDDGNGGNDDGTNPRCGVGTCTAIGWACGYLVDDCGQVVDCADEGLACKDNEVCVGGIDKPTECVPGGGTTCPVCSAIPECEDSSPTRLAGRVISPGRDDDDTGNQVGVPNAIVYISRTKNPDDLPAISEGIPSGGTSCDRCEDQDLGPVLVGAVTDATGRFVLEGNVPVGEEFLLVVKAGKFRRATRLTLEASAACTDTTLPSALPDNPTRLPRNMQDGLAVHIPRIAVTTGEIDAMECVFEKMGLAHEEFGNPGDDGNATPRVHLYRGGGSAPGRGARIDNDTPHDTTLYSDLDRLLRYDMLIADCEGGSWDGSNRFSQRDDYGDHVREYVNRGGRMFASHLSFSWLHENGDEPYSDADPIATGLGPAATWDTSLSSANSGTGRISLDSDHASPRIENFAEWMVSEGVTTAPDYLFNIIQPRSQATGLGDYAEEFVVRQGGNNRVQQFSINTPYGAPAEAACGRISYSGFHVAAGGGTSGNSPFANSTFPDHCSGDLTDQEKVLLYMLFDLGACVGSDPLPPPCTPITCEEDSCGYRPDGCGGVVDCGPCQGPIL